MAYKVTVSVSDKQQYLALRAKLMGEGKLVSSWFEDNMNDYLGDLKVSSPDKKGAPEDTEVKESQRVGRESQEEPQIKTQKWDGSEICKKHKVRKLSCKCK